MEIGRDFTALVGQNNSGKSSCLRLFYELRDVWSLLAHQTVPAMQGGCSVNYLGLDDYEEIFYNGNSRPLQFQVDIAAPSSMTDADALRVKKVTAKCDRQPSPNVWTCEFELVDQDGAAIALIPTGAFSNATHDTVHSSHQGNIDFSSLRGICQALANALYIGPFRNAINEGAGNYYDLAIGSTFISAWHSWQTGGIKGQARAIQRVTADIERIFEYSRLHITASEGKKVLVIEVDGKPYMLRELGAGLAQFIIVLGNCAVKKPSVVLIDEPELNLHPALQIDFLTSLASYASEGIVFATHSVGLARATAERILTFQKEENASRVRPFETITNYSEFVGALSFSTFKELGHDTILLVEGVTEVKAVQQLLRMFSKDHRIVLLPLGGSQMINGGIEGELSELKRLSKNIAAIIDSEKQSENSALSESRRAFSAVCEKLDIRLCVTNLRAFENYLSDKAIKVTFGEKYRALAPYEKLSAAALASSKSDNWRIARAMELPDIEDTDIGAFIKSL